jgi:hypothetical protein
MNQKEFIYLTAFEKQGGLLAMLDDFGFFERTRNEAGELVIMKQLRPAPEQDELSAWDFHVRYGPPAARLSEPAFIIPIEPRYHSLLFPDADKQLTLQAGVHPFGNGIRKAYLCRAPIRQIGAGDPLLFYRSHSEQGLTVVGVAEKTLASSDPEEIASAVGKRTVYSLRHIQEFCSKGEVLAILFRQAMLVAPDPIPMADLLQNGVLRAAPQSIVTVPRNSHAWLRHRLGL